MALAAGAEVPTALRPARPTEQILRGFAPLRVGLRSVEGFLPG